MLLHFAHANGIPGATYQPVLDRLEPHTGFAIGKLGHDPRFPCRTNWQPLADELIAYLEIHAKEPVLGIGHSLGSVVTFLAACKRPELFRGVLMLDPPLFWGYAALLAKLFKCLGKIDDITPAGKSKHRRRHWPDRQSAMEYFASKRLFQFHPDCTQAFLESVVEDAAEGGVKLYFDAEVEVAIFRTTPDDLRRMKRPAEVPMKVVYADCSDASLEKMVLPFGRHFDIPCEKISGEHMFPLQQPDLAADLIRRFIAEAL